MKVKIGKYIHFWSTRGVERKYIQLRHNSKHWEYDIDEGDFLDKLVSKVLYAYDVTVCRLVNKIKKRFFKRKVVVHIDGYDIWSLDHTLALIILPSLKAVRDYKSGIPYVDDEDVPVGLRSTSAPELTEEDMSFGRVDANLENRWKYVLNEMIHAFECTLDEDWDDQFHKGNIDHKLVEEVVGDNKLYRVERGPDHTHTFDIEAYKKAWARRMNGLRLFAKYYHALWT
jgi:hypothetical protein